jgi:NAD(P)-dependent dehydrogenase (short-subunit alcohol dehydrogenase family)
MAQQLSEQVAVVTGAGRGFGKAIALEFARHGAAVTLTSRTPSELDGVAAEILKAGGRVLAVAGNVTRSQDVERVISETERAHGPVSLLVSNAGVPGPFGPLWTIDPEVWWSAQEVHIRAPMLYLRRVLPGMVERRRGRVIIVSALASRVVAPYLSAYCTGKIAQTRITAEAAAEAKEFGVSVFAIDPGFVFTGIAEETMNSPDAQRWLPGMVARLRARKDSSDRDTDLVRCARRCLDLASGRYDALSGRYMELDDDIDAMRLQAESAAGQEPPRNSP